MTRILKYTFSILLLLIVFLVITFPFERLGPKVRTILEKTLRQTLQVTATCQIQGFDFGFPFGFSWELLSCSDTQDQTVLELTDGSISLFPFSQTLSGKIGKGKLTLNANAGFKSIPTRIEATFDKIPMDKFGAILGAAARRFNPFLSELKLEGDLSGKVNMPTDSFVGKSGSIDLRFANFKLPNQFLVKNLGLSEIVFSKSAVKAELNNSKLVLQDVAFLSDVVSGKAEGSVDFVKNGKQEDFSPSLTLKWKVQKSDALLSSGLGQALTAQPCPSPDGEGFCTRRVQRVQDLNFGF